MLHRCRPVVPQRPLTKPYRSFRAIKRLHNSNSQYEWRGTFKKSKTQRALLKNKNKDDMPLPRGIENKSIGVNDNRIVIYEN
jgi:hypothetical protein